MQFGLYPFEELNQLLSNITPNEQYSFINLGIGEPRFDSPQFVKDTLINNLNSISKYPPSDPSISLKSSIKGFIKRRFDVDLSVQEIIPSFGTKEVLFNFPQFYLYDKKSPKMMFTNPFYKIYEGSAIASKAKIYTLDLLKENGFKPKIDKEIFKQIDILIINSPNNPTGSMLNIDELKELIELCLEYNFVLLNDECYSEIYANTKPPSLLQASIEAGNSSFKNVLVVNSLSKRDSLAGLRSGFIAGDKEILKGYALYRTYLGCSIPLYLQECACVAWDDDEYALKYRLMYAKNLQLAKDILEVDVPSQTFYVWLEVADDLEFAKLLYKEFNVKALPGRFLGHKGVGEGFVRLSLVYNSNIMTEVLNRVKRCLNSFEEQSHKIRA